MTLRGLLPGACLALAACAPSAPPDNGVEAAAPPPAATDGAMLADIPGLEVQYYEVGGNTLFEIRRALNRVRPRDPNDGQPVDALSRWYIEWRWPAGADGGCDLARTELRFTASVRLPRLVEGRALPPAVRQRWRAYAAMLERHEAGHLRHAWENRDSVLRAIRVSNCAGANDAAQAAIRALAAWDVNYDRETRHGLTEGAHFP